MQINVKPFFFCYKNSLILSVYFETDLQIKTS